MNQRGPAFTGEGDTRVFGNTKYIMRLHTSEILVGLLRMSELLDIQSFFQVHNGHMLIFVYYVDPFKLLRLGRIVFNEANKI